MAKKPERFSQDTIWREQISPEELESWVRFVQEEVFDTLKKAGESVHSVDDIHLTVSVEYSTSYYRYSEVQGRISVITTRAGGFSSHFDIARFSSKFNAMNSFEEYARFKNATDVYERNDSFWTRKEITVA